MRSHIVISIIVFLSILLSGYDLLAQQMQNSVYGNYLINPEKVEKPTENELNKFVNAIKQVNEIERKFNEIYIEKLEESGLTLERFNQMKAEYQQVGDQLDATETEKQKFEKITKELTESQVSMKNTVLTAVESTGLEIKRYEEILIYANDNPEMKAKIKSMMIE